MSRYYLGDQIDIHGGGYDLIFPHHEAEIAQAESVTGKEPFVRYWMHVAMVDYQGEKMSKSLGNLVYTRDLLETHSADAIRLCLFQHHYRFPWEFFDGDMDGCDDAAEHLRSAVNAQGSDGALLDPAPWRDKFLAALDNDLDTPRAIDALNELAGEIHAAGDRNITEATSTLRELGGLLGLSFR